MFKNYLPRTSASPSRSKQNLTAEAINIKAEHWQQELFR